MKIKQVKEEKKERWMLLLAYFILVSVVVITTLNSTHHVNENRDILCAYSTGMVELIDTEAFVEMDEQEVQILTDTFLEANHICERAGAPVRSDD